jgi:DDE superfamily endonuclease
LKLPLKKSRFTPVKTKRAILRQYFTDALRVIETVPKNYGENIPMPASLSLVGVEAPMTISGTVDMIVSDLYRNRFVFDLNRVIIDNLPAHKVAGIRELIEAKGAKLIYLPPDLHPIEKYWSKIKTYLRKAKVRTEKPFCPLLRKMPKAGLPIADMPYSSSTIIAD